MNLSFLYQFAPAAQKVVPVLTWCVKGVGTEQGCMYLKEKASSSLGLHGYGKMMAFIEHRAQM